MRRLIRSFGYALAGLARMVRDEANARIHLAVSLVVVLAGLSLRVSAADWRWLVLAMGLVWAAEAMNTAFEHLCDVVSRAPSDAIKKAKDVAAGSVLVMAIVAAWIGVSVFWPYLF